MKTTLNEIWGHNPRSYVWRDLLNYLGKTKADDEPLEITTIIDSNGLDDALWCLRAVEGHDKEIRLFAVWCARQVQYLLTDHRSLDALDVAERYANGESTEVELVAAAARDAANAAEAAVDAAVDVWAAMWAAWAAAYAARDAAVAAMWAAAYAVDAARSDWSTAPYDKELRGKQEVELRRICEEIV